MIRPLATPGLLLIVAAILAAPCASRGEEVLRRAEVDKLVQPLIDDAWCNAVVVGVVNERGRGVAGYGRFSDTQPAAPDGKTLFEIGSVTKTFTGLLLAQMVEAGELSLDDPVQKLLPADRVTMPSRNGKAITLRHLTTHTSGIPRMPDNFHPKNPADPYADYTPQDMFDFLSHLKLERDPGETYEYSNIATALLGQALALHAGKSYEDLLVERICTPLGMHDTRITLTGALKARMAQPHTADGDPASTWDLGACGPAGGIRSTMDDMVTYVAAQLGLIKTPFDAAIARSQQPLFASPSHTPVAMNWHLSARGDMINHNGQTGGYHSSVFFVPKARVGIVILASTATDVIDKLGDQVLALHVDADRRAEPLKLPPLAKVAPKLLAEYAGNYILTPTETFTITAAGDRLFAQLTGQSRVRVFPDSDTRFSYRVVDATLDFERGQDGKVSGLVLHQNGKTLPAKRAN